MSERHLEMRILIIGGTSFIGPYVVRGLHERGHHVTLFHRGVTQADLPATVQHIHGNRQDLAQYAEQFAQLQPQVVIDMIPATEQESRTVMDTVRGLAERVVAISSADVYRAYDRLRRADPGSSDSVPLTEESPLRERFYPYRDTAANPADRFYHYDKILVERVVMGDPQLPGTVLRLPYVYGPGDWQHRFGASIRRMDAQRSAILMDEHKLAWRRSFGFVANVAEAIVLAATMPQAAGRIYNVADEPALTEQARLDAISQQAGWSGRIVGMPMDRLPDHLREDLDFTQAMVIDSTRIRRELGYTERVPHDEAVRQTITWERANPIQDNSPAEYAAEDAVLDTR